VADSQTLDIGKLEAFIAVIEAGSLLAGSRSSGIPRSTLRRQVAELEQDIGQALVTRKGGKLVATEAGQIVFERGKAVLAACAGLLRDARTVGDGVGRRMQIALPPAVPTALISEIWQTSHQRFSEPATVRVVEHPLRALDDGMDMAVHVGESVPDGPWQSVELRSTRLQLFASRAYLARNPAPETVEQLAAHTLLCCVWPDSSPDTWPLCNGGSIRISPKLVSNHEALVRQLVMDGGGIALLPEVDLDGARPGDCVPVLPGVVGGALSIYVVVPNELADMPRPGTPRGPDPRRHDAPGTGFTRRG